MGLGFWDESENNPNQWTWDFQGGTPATSSDQNPVISYDTPGTYDVTLSITDGNSNDQITKTGYIIVREILAPVANFYATKTVLPVGGTTQFVDLSLMLPHNGSWTFEGGTPTNSTIRILLSHIILMELMK